jgi:hypothetical protein
VGTRQEAGTRQKEEGGHGLRGGFPALSPASTHPQPKRPLPRLSQLPPDKPSFQQTPRRRQQLYPCRRSRSRCLRCSVNCRSWLRHCRRYLRSRHRYRWLHHRSWHPLRINRQKKSVRQPGLVAGPQSWPKNNTSPPQPTSSPLAPLAPANSPPSSASQPTSSLPAPDPFEPALSPPSPASQLTSSASALLAPSPSPLSAAELASLHLSAEISALTSHGYTLVLKWCPICKTNFIDNCASVCYACLD